METCIARFFDGEHSFPYEANLTLTDSTLQIQYSSNHQDRIIVWPYASLVIIERLYQNRKGVISSKLMPQARLNIENEGFFKRLESYVTKKQIQKTNVPHSWKMMLVFSLLFVIGLIIILWGYPKITPFIAKAIPYSWDDNLGQWVVENIAQGKKECVNPAGQHALNKLIKQVSTSEQPYKVKVIDFGPDEINAFATAGNHIVIMSGLIDFVESPEELIGVVAHEMGHAIEHHPTDGLLRVLGINIVMVATFGTSATYPTQLLHMKYSREKEAEADQIAVKLLKSANINVLGLATFFERLNKKVSGLNDYDAILEYVSDHPGLQSRIQMIKSQAQDQIYHSPLTIQEWQAIKGICTKKTNFQ